MCCKCINFALDVFIADWINTLVIYGKIATDGHVEVANNILMSVMYFIGVILYVAIFRIYLLLINKKYVRKEYQL